VATVLEKKSELVQLNDDLLNLDAHAEKSRDPPDGRNLPALKAIITFRLQSAPALIMVACILGSKKVVIRAERCAIPALTIKVSLLGSLSLWVKSTLAKLIRVAEETLYKGIGNKLAGNYLPDIIAGKSKTTEEWF